MFILKIFIIVTLIIASLFMLLFLLYIGAVIFQYFYDKYDDKRNNM